jgi:hypothetical protein
METQVNTSDPQWVAIVTGNQYYRTGRIIGTFSDIEKAKAATSRVAEVAVGKPIKQWRRLVNSPIGESYFASRRAYPKLEGRVYFYFKIEPMTIDTPFFDGTKG